MATFTEIHGISLADNSYIENMHVELLASDPTPVEAGRIWYNSSEKQYKASTYDAGGAVIIVVLGGKEQLDAYILDLASQTRGEGSALVGYAGVVGTNGEFTTAAGTAEATFDALTQGIDANAQALSDLGDGSITDLQNELDATQVGAGLETTGAFIASVGSNYAGAAATIKGATELIDSAVKSNADALVTEITDRATADALKVDKAGDTMSGALSMGTNRITNVDTPVDDHDATNKLYVDTAVQGIDWKDSVKATSTTDISLTSLLTIDDVVLADGDRVLVQGQTDAAENGLYEARAAAWVRTADADGNPGYEVSNGMAVFVEAGTAFGGNGFVLTTQDPIVVGTDDLEFSQFSGAGQIVAGAGISKTGNELFLNFGAGIKELPSDEIGIEPFISGGMMTTEDGTNASVGADAQLAIKLDGITLETNTNGLKITDAYTQTRVDAEATIQNELDATQVGAGLDADGGLTIAGNYVDSAANIKVAVTNLDTAVKVNEDGLAQEVTDRTDADTAIQAELDATQAGAGLGTDGTFTANASANYVNGATDLFNATILLDTAVKTNTDGLAQEVTDRTTAVSTLKTALNALSYTFESDTPATSHTIAHNLGEAFVTVALWIKQIDGSFKNDIAQVTLNNNNQLTVDLTVAKDIRIVVTSSKDV